MGVALYTILGALAQLEREMICERVRAGMANATWKVEPFFILSVYKQALNGQPLMIQDGHKVRFRLRRKLTKLAFAWRMAPIWRDVRTLLLYSKLALLASDRWELNFL